MSDAAQDTNQSSNTRLAVTLALFTLLGGLITSGVGWMSAQQAASSAYRQYCLTRIDTKEATIREKVENFLVAQGSLASLSSHHNLDIALVEQHLDAVSSTGFALSSYFDGELSETTKSVAMDYGDKLDFSEGVAKSSQIPADKSRASEQLKSDMKIWYDQYKLLLKNFEDERAKCN